MTKTEVESNERSGTRKTTDLIVQPNCYFYKLVYSFSQIQTPYVTTANKKIHYIKDILWFTYNSISSVFDLQLKLDLVLGGKNNFLEITAVSSTFLVIGHQVCTYSISSLNRFSIGLTFGDWHGLLFYSLLYCLDSMFCGIMLDISTPSHS